MASRAENAGRRNRRTVTAATNSPKRGWRNSLTDIPPPSAATQPWGQAQLEARRQVAGLCPQLGSVAPR